MKIRSILAGATLAAAITLPAVASAATGYATANVNLRAGPGTQYPVATVVAAGAPVNVIGCLSNYSWCDISYAGVRGWISGRYLEQAYAGNRVLVPNYGARIGVPIISFSFGNYWDNNYRGRSFYRDRDRYDDRRDARRDQRIIEREREDFVDDRREVRRDIRQADSRREKRDLREDRRELRDDFRDDVCRRTGRRCD